jgi:hypothetical protein
MDRYSTPPDLPICNEKPRFSFQVTGFFCQQVYNFLQHGYTRRNVQQLLLMIFITIFGCSPLRNRNLSTYRALLQIHAPCPHDHAGQESDTWMRAYVDCIHARRVDPVIGSISDQES